MRVNNFPRKRPTGLELPKMHLRPCPIHPDDTGMASAPKRCAECMRIQRRARFAAMGEAIGSLYATHRYQARARGHEFTLTLERFKYLVSQPCVYGYSPANSGNHAKVGLDRRDNSKGYTHENAQPCCGRHNLLKSVLTHEQTLDAVHRYKIPCGDRRGTSYRCSTPFSN